MWFYVYLFTALIVSNCRLDSLCLSFLFEWNVWFNEMSAPKRRQCAPFIHAYFAAADKADTFYSTTKWWKCTFHWAANGFQIAFELAPSDSDSTIHSLRYTLIRIEYYVQLYSTNDTICDNFNTCFFRISNNPWKSIIYSPHCCLPQTISLSFFDSIV